MRLKRIEKEIIKEPFSQSQDDIDADHHHDVGDLIISTDQSYYVEDILYCEGKEDDQRILLPDTESFSKDTVRKNDGDEIAKTYNYRVLISDGSGTIVYSSEGEKSLMYKSLWNILNENLDKISNQIKKQGYAVMTNTNKSMGTSINLMGYLDGDYTVIISTPMESIQTSARLSGQFTMYVGLILIICGAVAMYLYSRQFTKPIEDMAKAANQMSHLDFDVKVPTGSDDELGRLGASINELSSKLEFTISELKTANNELQKDIEQKVQIDEMRKEFLSHVSHELKTPIALMGIFRRLERQYLR